jgi:hypothetical protein
MALFGNRLSLRKLKAMVGREVGLSDWFAVTRLGFAWSMAFTVATSPALIAAVMSCPAAGRPHSDRTAHIPPTRAHILTARGPLEARSFMLPPWPCPSPGMAPDHRTGVRGGTI